MIKGWKNDPRWVEHYAKRDEERARATLERIHAQEEISYRRAEMIHLKGELEARAASFS